MDITTGFVASPQQVPTSFLGFLATTKQNDFQRLFDFAVDTLTFSTKVNIFHWTCKKGFLHAQFEAVYELLRKFADDLTETVLAQDVKFNITNRESNIVDMIYDTEYALRKITEYRDEAARIGDFFKDNRSINKLFDDLVAELDKHIGLIKNFE